MFLRRKAKAQTAPLETTGCTEDLTLEQVVEEYRMQLYQNDTVLIYNLSSSLKYNGLLGKVGCFGEVKRRYHVRINGEGALVKRENLMRQRCEHCLKEKELGSKGGIVSAGTSYFSKECSLKYNDRQ